MSIIVVVGALVLCLACEKKATEAAVSETPPPQQQAQAQPRRKTLGVDQNQLANRMASIYDQVATDAVAQYGIAKRQGDTMQICSQAGMVSAAYLQAKNETKYREWKAIEKGDCAAAGLTP